MKNFKPLLIPAIAFLMTGCAQSQADEFNRNLEAISQSLSGNIAAPSTATRPPESKTKTEVSVPSDEHVRNAMNEALPTIDRVLAIHQCVKEGAGMRQMNFYAAPGVDASSGMAFYKFPNSQEYMQYHDRNSCVSIKAIDQWSMPALNALKFRAVYFAEDSGETVNFFYFFTRGGDGKWLLGAPPKCPLC